MSREKSIFSAIFGGFFADFRLCFSNLKYARDCRGRRPHPSQADEVGSATIPQKDGRVHPKGLRGRSQTSSVFMPPSSRPQTRNPLRQGKAAMQMSHHCAKASFSHASSLPESSCPYDHTAAPCKPCCTAHCALSQIDCSSSPLTKFSPLTQYAAFAAPS